MDGHASRANSREAPTGDEGLLEAERQERWRGIKAMYWVGALFGQAELGESPFVADPEECASRALLAALLPAGTPLPHDADAVRIELRARLEEWFAQKPDGDAVLRLQRRFADELECFVLPD